MSSRSMLQTANIEGRMEVKPKDVKQWISTCGRDVLLYGNVELFRCYYIQGFIY